MKRTLAVAATVLVATALTGCGGGDGGSDNAGGSSGGSYCDVAKDIESQLNSFDVQSINEQSYETLRSSVDDLAAAAPDDIKDDIERLATALDEFRALIEKAGLSLDDLQSGSVPPTADPAKLAQLQKDLQDWTAKYDIEADQDNIAKSLKDECGIDINGSSSDSGS